MVWSTLERVCGGYVRLGKIGKLENMKIRGTNIIYMVIIRMNPTKGRYGFMRGPMIGVINM